MANPSSKYNKVKPAFTIVVGGMDAACLAVIQGSIISQTNGFAYFVRKQSRKSPMRKHLNFT
jgi:hypothetical protein